MKFRKLLLSILSLGILALSSACSSTESVGEKANKKTTFLGIYTCEPACYAPKNQPSFSIESEDVTGMDLPSGDKISWLWGLITYTDY